MGGACVPVRGRPGASADRVAPLSPMYSRPASPRARKRYIPGVAGIRPWQWASSKSCHPDQDRPPQFAAWGSLAAVGLESLVMRSGSSPSSSHRCAVPGADVCEGHAIWMVAVDAVLKNLERPTAVQCDMRCFGTCWDYKDDPPIHEIEERINWLVAHGANEIGLL